MPEKVVITRDDAAIVIEFGEHWSGARDEHGAVRVQLFGRDGLVEIILAPSELASIAALVETATAFAAAEKLRRSAESAPAPRPFPGFNGNAPLQSPPVPPPLMQAVLGPPIGKLR